ncbi:hypothetical protein [Kitasatospora phosalacinea]|uniref:hypothetical protein n=1 Tax=Kitasatospora phosalacinea TaxID=2065 RepID=UPI000A86483C|nr:hypothetical protein [Kitasatospora phosalacinea]
MRRIGMVAALLSALAGLLLVLTGSAVAEGFRPGPPVVEVCVASLPAERSEPEQDLPAGVPARHASHVSARPGSGTCNGLRPVGPYHAPAEPVLPSCTPRTGPGAPPPYPSRRTGGATASVFQVFRC